MKRYFLIFLALLLTGCSGVKRQSSSVTTPKLTKPPIYGKWVITKTIFKENIGEDRFKYKSLIGSDIIFSEEGVSIANIVAKSPNFKLRKLNSKFFIEKEYNYPIENLGFRDDIIDIIDIKEKDEFFCQVLRQQMDRIIIFCNGIFIVATKVSDTISKEELDSLNTSSVDGLLQSVSDKNARDNGVIIGLKYSNGNDEFSEYSYSSLFIKLSQEDGIAHYFKDGIIVPRQSNFIKVGTEREVIEEKISDKITIRYSNIGGEDPIIKYADVEPGILKGIEFISPDYINFEEYNTSSGRRSLNLKFIDSLEAYGSLSLGNIVEDGDKIFIDSSKTISDRLDITSLDERNIGINRENGYWKFKGRVDIEGRSNQYKDFDINILIPKEIVKYDELSISTSELQKEFPEMKDCFISPNNKFLIVVENSKIVIYNIIGGRVSDEPLYEIELDKNYSIIMSEWAIGRYTDLWEREFKGE